MWYSKWVCCLGYYSVGYKIVFLIYTWYLSVIVAFTMRLRYGGDYPEYTQYVQVAHLRDMQTLDPFEREGSYRFAMKTRQGRRKSICNYHVFDRTVKRASHVFWMRRNNAAKLIDEVQYWVPWTLKRVFARIVVRIDASLNFRHDTSSDVET